MGCAECWLSRRGAAADSSQCFAEGRSGLYRGMETKLWHSTLISALMFLSYEKIQLAVARVVTGEAGEHSDCIGEGRKTGGGGGS